MDHSRSLHEVMGLQLLNITKFTELFSTKNQRLMAPPPGAAMKGAQVGKYVT